MRPNVRLALKVGVAVVPIVMAVLTAIYGDVTPIVRDLCEAALPATIQVKEVDAGAPR